MELFNPYSQLCFSLAQLLNYLNSQRIKLLGIKQTLTINQNRIKNRPSVH